ncbi:MAG: SDR family NAD(P)-dependent oxidoreductase [Parvularculaceae bacterium]
MARLQNKVAIVTGAADGMGEATTRLFAAEGAKVLAIDMNADKLAAAHDGDAGVKTHVADICADGAPEAIVGAATAAFGGLDVIVNTAGVVDYAPADQLRAENWRRTMAVNLDAMFFLCQRAIPEMRRRGGGRIVNVASINAVVTAPGLAAYAASKHGVAGLTKTLAVELGPDMITANYILPGAILTGMTRPLMDDPDTRALFESFAVIPRMGAPEDIAKGALFLASDDASFITGHGLTIDGGFLAKVK